MPLPTRPVSGAPIESEWGTEIHDRVLAAAGCALHGTTRTVGSTALKVALDAIDDDPGGFSNGSNGIEIPTDRQGLYLINVIGQTVNGDVGSVTRFFVYLNGTAYAAASTSDEGAVNLLVPITVILPLVATDVIEVYAQNTGGGTTPTVRVNQLQMVRITDAYGA